MSNEELDAIAAQALADQEAAVQAELDSQGRVVDDLLAKYPEGLRREDFIGRTATVNADDLAQLLATYSLVLDCLVNLVGSEPPAHFTLVVSRVLTQAATDLGLVDAE